MKNGQKIIFSCIGLEGIFAIFFTLLVPKEIQSENFFGFSFGRMVIISFLFLGSVSSILLAINSNSNNNNFSNQILLFVLKNRRFFFFLFLFLFFSLVYPPNILREKYFAQFERLFFLFSWIAISILEILLYYLGNQVIINGFKGFIKSHKSKIIKVIPILICIAFPFIFMSPRLWIIDGHHYSIGNDFVPFSYFYKVYLLDYILHFRLPLWSPSEAAGFPFLFSPQVGALYPINLLLAFYYWWKGNYGLLDHTWATVFGLSIFCLGLYAWLCEFNWKSKVNVVIAVLIVSVSYQMTEIIRFTKAVESIAWLPWMLFFFTKIFKDSFARKSFLFYFLFSFAFFSFLTAGYLYYQYYSIFIIFPYIFLLLNNGIRKHLGFTRFMCDKWGVINAIFSLLIPSVILLPYFMNMSILLNQVHRRAVKDYIYSTEHSFTIIDHIGSLVFPPISSPEGWYYWGILPLILIIYYFISRRNEFKGNSFYEERYLSIKTKFILGSFLFLIFLISLGRDTILFNFLWNYFPFFYAFRYWGRFTIVFIPIVCFIVVISLEIITNRINTFQLFKRQISVHAIIYKWILIIIIILLLAFIARQYPLNDQWLVSFYLIHDRLYTYSISLFCSIFYIIACLFYIYKSKRPSTRLIKTGFVIITIVDLWVIGAFQWALDIIPEENPPKIINIAEKVIPLSFNYPRTWSKTNISITPQFSVGTSPDWYFERYYLFYNEHAYEYEYRDKFLGRGNDATKIYFSKSIQHYSVKAFLDDAANFSGSIIVEKYDGEELIIRVFSENEGYISFIDNWDPFWTAYVDNKSVPIEKLFNSFKSVKINSGESVVKFLYKPVLLPVKEFLEARKSNY